jgi:hypothetical protein
MWPAASGSPKIMGMTTLHIPNGPTLGAHRITIPNRLGKCLPPPRHAVSILCHGTRSLRCRNSSRPSTGKEAQKHVVVALQRHKTCAGNGRCYPTSFLEWLHKIAARCITRVGTVTFARRSLMLKSPTVAK